MAKTKRKSKSIKCGCCGGKMQVGVFHSRCCRADFKGRILGGKYLIVCQSCGKFVAFIDVDLTDKFEEMRDENKI